MFVAALVRAPVRCFSSSVSAPATPFPIPPSDPDSEAKCGYDSVGNLEVRLFLQHSRAGQPGDLME